MPTGTDVRKYRETILEQSKAALGEARKPLFATVGAYQVAYDRVRTQLKDLPTETQEQLKKLQDETQAQLKKLQERAQERAATLEPARVRKTVEEYAEQARETYETLAKRGERVVRRLRRDPRVRNAFAETEELVERTEELVTDKPASTAPATGATHRAPARKAPARKTTAKS
jgi:heparin binding hemagglutinin HbhA